jgi:hypothetical protein|tara:strand:- start:15 stop:284 length:270 start_codon:yes stop_codon:yes gene_type:complete
MGSGELLVIIYYIVILILCFLCGKFASNRGKSFWGYFFLSFFLTPLIGFIAVLIVTRKKQGKISSREQEKTVGGVKKCSNCGAFFCECS